jgi:hypothetical protein
MKKEAGWAQGRYGTKMNVEGIEYECLNLFNMVQNRKQ